VESSFAIIAEPNRRAILSLLLSSERSVGELESKLGLSQPSVSKHLGVLREAGFVEARIAAQQRLYRLRPEPLMELDAWLEPFRRFWSKHIDALERHLDNLDETKKVATVTTITPEELTNANKYLTPARAATMLQRIIRIVRRAVTGRSWKCPAQSVSTAGRLLGGREYIAGSLTPGCDCFIRWVSSIAPGCSARLYFLPS
jgi:DNA-binding transcriptional ArsR family regulator